MSQQRAPSLPPRAGRAPYFARPALQTRKVMEARALVAVAPLLLQLLCRQAPPAAAYQQRRGKTAALPASTVLASRASRRPMSWCLSEISVHSIVISPLYRLLSLNDLPLVPDDNRQHISLPVQ